MEKRRTARAKDEIGCRQTGIMKEFVSDPLFSKPMNYFGNVIVPDTGMLLSFLFSKT